MTIADLGFSPKRWEQFWRAFKAEPHQLEAIELLRRHINQADPALLTESAEWVSRFSPAAKATAKPAELHAPLTVPWFDQNDNQSGKGYRECFSSSCAMVAAFYGKVPSDDAYNSIRARFGDSTDSGAQVRALRSLGLAASFHTDGTPERLKQLIDQGRPVPVGWLHHGTPQQPRGGGHWSVLIGYTQNDWLMNDPNGEANLVAGGYLPNRNGHAMRYSTLNWNPRWMPDGPGTGWYMLIEPAR